MSSSHKLPKGKKGVSKQPVPSRAEQVFGISEDDLRRIIQKALGQMPLHVSLSTGNLPEAKVFEGLQAYIHDLNKELMFLPNEEGSTQLQVVQKFLSILAKAFPLISGREEFKNFFTVSEFSDDLISELSTLQKGRHLLVPGSCEGLKGKTVLMLKGCKESFFLLNCMRGLSPLGRPINDRRFTRVHLAQVNSQPNEHGLHAPMEIHVYQDEEEIYQEFVKDAEEDGKCTVVPGSISVMLQHSKETPIGNDLEYYGDTARYVREDEIVRIDGLTVKPVTKSDGTVFRIKRSPHAIVGLDDRDEEDFPEWIEQWVDRIAAVCDDFVEETPYSNMLSELDYTVTESKSVSIINIPMNDKLAALLWHYRRYTLFKIFNQETGTTAFQTFEFRATTKRRTQSRRDSQNFGSSSSKR